MTLFNSDFVELIDAAANRCLVKVSCIALITGYLDGGVRVSLTNGDFIEIDGLSSDEVIRRINDQLADNA